MAQAKDPVCGMMVDTATAQYKTEAMGNTYYFCSADCKRTFDKDPQKYAQKEATVSRQQAGSRNPKQEELANQVEKGSPNVVPELRRDRQEDRPIEPGKPAAGPAGKPRKA